MSREQAEEALEVQQERDRRKERLCEENGYVIRFPYSKEVTIENVRACGYQRAPALEKQW